VQRFFIQGSAPASVLMVVNNAKATQVTLPIRIEMTQVGPRIRINGADAGWSTIRCDNVEHAREIMARYPSAAMPCWRNPGAIWNR
jgi:hypothetical protein